MTVNIETAIYVVSFNILVWGFLIHMELGRIRKAIEKEKVGQ